jgi:hypothetical protein
LPELGGLNQGIDDGGVFAATANPTNVQFCGYGDATPDRSAGVVTVASKKPGGQ